MHIVLIGMNYNTASLELREKFSFSDEELENAMTALMKNGKIHECVILPTCNRVELFTVMDLLQPQLLKSFLCDYHSYKNDLSPYIYIKTDQEAVMHMCAVGAGLDSMVIGEPQIFSQVKEAYQKALELKGAGLVCRMVFPMVFSVIKKVRSETGIGKRNLSISHVACNLVEEIFPEVNKSTVMVVGIGEMGKLTVKLLKRKGIKEILVTNRTFKKAVELAEEIGRPGAGRAVGQAMSRNPVAIVIPCHRVIASGGKLGGFGNRLDLKWSLLSLETDNGLPPDYPKG